MCGLVDGMCDCLGVYTRTVWLPNYDINVLHPVMENMQRHIQCLGRKKNCCDNDNSSWTVFLWKIFTFQEKNVLLFSQEERKEKPPQYNLVPNRSAGGTTQQSLRPHLWASCPELCPPCSSSPAGTRRWAERRGDWQRRAASCCPKGPPPNATATEGRSPEGHPDGERAQPEEDQERHTELFPSHPESLSDMISSLTKKNKYEFQKGNVKIFSSLFYTSSCKGPLERP